MRENPNITVLEASRLLGERWKALDQHTKSYYEAKSQEAKVLYEQQVALFEAKYGKIEKKSKARKARVPSLGGTGLVQMGSS